MGFYYPVQNSGWIIGDADATTTLTATYGDNTFSIPVGGMVQLELSIAYTPKTGQTNRVIYIQVEFGYGTDYYMHTVMVEDTTTTTLYQNTYDFTGATGGTEYKFIMSAPVSQEMCRVSVKEDGSSNFGECSVRASLSGK